MNISWAIGLAGGGLIGGWLYKHHAEKHTLLKFS
jgi:prephenate dehydrogenase